MRSIKTTKLAQASTVACSSYAMLEQHGSTRSSCRLDTSNVSSPVETWRAKWNLGLSCYLLQSHNSRPFLRCGQKSTIKYPRQIMQLSQNHRFRFLRIATSEGKYILRRQRPICDFFTITRRILRTCT